MIIRWLSNRSYQLHNKEVWAVSHSSRFCIIRKREWTKANLHKTLTDESEKRQRRKGNYAEPKKHAADIECRLDNFDLFQRIWDIQCLAFHYTSFYHPLVGQLSVWTVPDLIRVNKLNIFITNELSSRSYLALNSFHFHGFLECFISSEILRRRLAREKMGITSAISPSDEPLF